MKSKRTTLPPRPAKKLRIEWHVNGASGVGVWEIDTPRNRAFLENCVKNYNTLYGENTHKLIEREFKVRQVSPSQTKIT